MSDQPNIMELCLSDGVGGLELYVLRTAQQMQQRNHHCVSVVRPGTMLASRMDEDGIRYHGLQKRNKWLPLSAALQLARVIDQEKVDVIHMHWAKDLNLAVLAKLFSRRPVKLLYSRHMMITRPKHDFYHRWLYRHVDRLLAVTDELCGLMREFLPMPAEAIETLYLGVDAPPALTAQQRIAIRHEYGFTEDDFVIFMVGRIEEYKGQHLLVEALELLHQQALPVRAIIVGPAMDEGYLQRLRDRVADSQLSASIKIPGSIKQASHLTAAFDVALLATECETFGLVLIEAMRAGVAVIGTAACGVLEIIDDGKSGLLFPPNDGKALGAVIRRLYEDAGFRRQLAQAGKQKADEVFATEAHFDQLEQVFSNLLADT